MATEEEEYADELFMRFGKQISPEQAREFVERSIIPEHAVCILREREEEKKRKLKEVI